MTMVELFSDPKRWTRRAYARDNFARPVLGASPDAVCWCLLGACKSLYPGDLGVLHALHDSIIKLYPAMNCGLLQSGVISVFNDNYSLDDVRKVVADARV